MDYYSNKISLYEYVNQLRCDRQLSYYNYPLDIVTYCEMRNDIVIDHYSFNTTGLCGIAMLGDKSDTIILNSGRSEREQNFDCGHELIHVTKHRNLGEECFRCFTTPKENQNQILEWEANEGSAELLVPYRLFLPKVKAAYNKLRTWRDLKCLKTDLALEFNVSMAVIYYRLESLKCEIMQYNNGTPLGQVTLMSQTEQSAHGVHIRSLNDMFHN